MKSRNSRKPADKNPQTSNKLSAVKPAGAKAPGADLNEKVWVKADAILTFGNLHALLKPVVATALDEMAGKRWMRCMALTPETAVSSVWSGNIRMIAPMSLYFNVTRAAAQVLTKERLEAHIKKVFTIVKLLSRFCPDLVAMHSALKSVTVERLVSATQPHPDWYGCPGRPSSMAPRNSITSPEGSTK